MSDHIQQSQSPVRVIGESATPPGFDALYTTITDAQLYKVSPLLNADHVDALLASWMPVDIYDQGTAERLREVQATVYGFVSIAQPKHDADAECYAALRPLGLVYLAALRTGKHDVAHMIYHYCRTTRLWFVNRHTNRDQNGGHRLPRLGEPA